MLSRIFRTAAATVAIAGFAAAIAAAWPAADAVAADAWPAARPIRLIVPFATGGGGDTMARLVMTRAARELGQAIVIDNIGGAGGNIGTSTAARAAADGYTLLYGTNGTHGINPTLYRQPGYDAEKDFEPITQLTRIAAMVVVRPSFPAKTMPDLLQLLKASPGKFTFASAGNGTTSHLAGELLKVETGIDMVHVPYRGGGLAMTDLIGGQVDLMIDVVPNTAAQVRGGRVSGLAVTTATRIASFPDMPTVAESGVKGFDVSAWDAIFAPAGTPKAIISRVDDAIARALADPELQAQLKERGAEAAHGGPDALRQHVSAEIARWGKAVKRANATVD